MELLSTARLPWPASAKKVLNDERFKAPFMSWHWRTLMEGHPGKLKLHSANTYWGLKKLTECVEDHVRLTPIVNGTVNKVANLYLLLLF